MRVYVRSRGSSYSRLMFTGGCFRNVSNPSETHLDQLRTNAYARRLTDMHKASDHTTTDNDRLLTSKEVAELIGVKPGTLRQWRTKNRGPRYRKQPGPAQAPVRYRAGDVEAWRKEKAQADDPTTWPVAETTP